MRAILLLFLSVPLFTCCQQGGKPFILKGRLRDFPDSAMASRFYLLYEVDGRKIRDSAAVMNGRFTFRGTLKEPVEADLMAVASSPGTKLAEEYTYLVYPIYIEPGSQKLVARKRLHTTAFKARGAKTNSQYIALWQDTDNYWMKYIRPINLKILEARNKGDREMEGRLQRVADSMYLVSKETVYRSFITRYPSSPVALYAFERYSRRSTDPEGDEAIFNSLSPAVKNTTRGRLVASKIDEGKITGIGKQAPGFTQDDTLGKPVTLASFRGNYVLLDFWASWCVPCRLENPNLVKANDRYRDRNFRIVSISLDREQDRDKWIRAIRQDKLNWTHLSDLRFWNNAVAVEYGINAIPQNLLIDPEGNIIAKNLQGAMLEKVLKMLFAGKKAF